jgi:hypothetical protein
MGKMIEWRAVTGGKGGRWAAVLGGGTPRPIFARGIGRPRVSITELQFASNLWLAAEATSNACCILVINLLASPTSISISGE